MRRWIIISVIATMLMGCNLLASPTPPPTEITINITGNPAPTSTASINSNDAIDVSSTENTPASSENRDTNTPQSSVNETEVCQAPLNWVTYTVQAGDTLFGIAQASNSSVAELSRVNCLESVDALSIGQVLFIPQAVTTTNINNSIVYWVGSDTRIDDNSVEIGCITYLNPVRTTIERTGDPSQDIEVVLTQLFNDQSSLPYRNLWAGRELTVTNVSVANGIADIQLTGDTTLTGTCADVDLRYALIFSILTNANVETMRITANGVNLAQLFDMSGLVGADAVFSGTDYALPIGYP
ncbi:MAG: LysM peptidoglycan-binding domain-containing protein [Chloroflexota bacterium]